MTDKELNINNPLEKEQEAAQEIENIKQWIREKKGEDFNFSDLPWSGDNSIFERIEIYGFEETKTTFFRWEKENEEWAKYENIALFLEYLRESNQAQKLQLTKRINSLLEMVPSNESLSGEKRVKDYFLEREENAQFLKEMDDFLIKQKIKTIQKFENGKLKIKVDLENYNLFHPKFPWGRNFNKVVSFVERYEILKVKEIQESFELGKKQFLEKVNLLNPLTLPFALLLPSEEIPSKEFKELEKVKELALTEPSNQGEVKKFISTVGIELANIKAEIEKRENEYMINEEAFLKERENWENQTKNLKNEGERIINEIKTEKDKQIEKLKEIVKKAQEEAEKLNQERKEKKELEKKLLETQNQIHSPDKVNLEELKEKHRKLELAAKTNEEILNAWKIKLDDYKILVEQLKEEREQEEKEKSRFLQLYINQKNIETDDHAEISRLKIELKAEKTEVENQKNNFETKLSNLKLTHQDQQAQKDKELKDLEETCKKYYQIKNDLYAENHNLRNQQKDINDENIDLKETKKNHERKIKQLEEEKGNLEQRKNQLTEEKKQLQAAKETAEKDLTKAIQKGRLTALGNVVQGALDYVPGVPKAWKSLGKSSIQAGSAALIIYDLPNWSYEAIIIAFGLICWYALKALYYRIFGRKEINLVNELRSELQESRSKVIMLKDELKELKEQATTPKPKNKQSAIGETKEKANSKKASKPENEKQPTGKK